MAAKTGCGIDIGDDSLKLVELKKTKTGIELSKTLVIKLQLKPSQKKGEREAAIGEALERLTNEAGVARGTSLTVAPPGLSAFIRYVKLPPVTKKRLQQIVGYEAQQQVPFPLEEVTWNYQTLEGKSKTETNIILVAIKSEVINLLLSTMSSYKLEPSIIEHRPLALYNCVKFNGQTAAGEVAVIVDIGARATDLSIEKEGELCWTRSARVGGADITEAIARELNVTFVEAEKLKQEKASCLLTKEEEESADEETRTIWKAIQPVIQEVLTELQRSVRYFHSQLEGERVDSIVLTGGSAKLKNFDRLVSQQIGAQVKFLDPFKNIVYSPEIFAHGDTKSGLGVATGLALRSLGEGFSKINLLPQTVISRKELHKKRAYLVFSGVSLALILAVSAVFAIETSSVMKTKLDSISDEIKSYESNELKIKNVVTEQELIQQKISLFRNLMGKRDYWANVLLELSRVVPANARLLKAAIVEKDTMKIQLEGKADEYETVTQLTVNLEESPYFREVEILIAHRVERTPSGRVEGGRTRRGTEARDIRTETEVEEKESGIDFTLRARLIK